MSSDEAEAFEITEDDLNNEFNPSQRVRTKEEMLYGVFAEDSRAGFGSRDHQKGQGNFHRPMAFVSAGTSVTKSEDENMDSDAEDMETNKAILDDIGAGKAPTDAAPTQTLPAAKEEAKATFDARTAASRVAAKRTANPFQKGKPKSVFQTASTTATEAPKYSMFSSKTKKVDREFGKWQKGSTGFGQKYLEKFGWKVGQGAGSAGHGIVEPIDVKLRKPKMGLQNSGERTAQSRRDFGGGEESEAAKAKKFQEELQQWRSKEPGKGKQKKPKYVFKSVDDLVAEGLGDNNDIAAVVTPVRKEKIVDMTKAHGPRVLDGYHEIDSANASPAIEKAQSPQLQSYVSTLANHATSDVIRLSSKIKREHKRQDGLKLEFEKTERKIQIRDRHIQRLQDIIVFVKSCKDRLNSATNPLELNEVASSLSKIQEDFPEEFQLYGLSKMAIALTFPLLKKRLQSWSPFAEPSVHIPFVKSLQTILNEKKKARVDIFDESDNEMVPFEQMCWNLVLPPIRAVLTSWDPRNHAPAVALIYEWQELLPDWINENIQDQLLLPRLTDAVDSWDPVTEKIPIHEWLKPWHLLLGSKLAGLFSAVREKLSSALQAWHPSDGSAYQILKPWMDTFDRKDKSAIISRSIMPKLEMVIRELPVNPKSQDLEPFKWVMQWKVFAGSELAKKLAEYFLPKFLSALCDWLSQGNVQFNEISNWYLGWKDQFGERFCEDPAIRGQLLRALDLMNRAALARLGEPMPTREKHNRARVTIQEKSKPAQHDLTGLNLRELVQRVADSSGLSYLPKVGRTTDSGDQIYSFGKLTIYIKQGVVFVKKSKDSSYEPISIDELPQLAR